jgi:predicted Fe-Mo cluster-binding NifX family protein
MIVAVSTDGDYVSEHFGRCPHFTIATIEDGLVKTKDIFPNPGHSPGSIPQFLHDKGVNAVLAGGAGQRAIGLFSQFGIELYTGVSGKVEDALKDFAQGSIKSDGSSCKPGSGRGYGIDKDVCDHE